MSTLLTFWSLCRSWVRTSQIFVAEDGVEDGDLTVAEALALPPLGTLNNALLSCTLYAEGFSPCTTENLISSVLRLLCSPPFYIYAYQFFNDCSLWY